MSTASRWPARILQGANRTFLVPAVLAKVLESGEDAVKLFSALKTYAYGASPMPLAAAARGAGGVAEHRLHPGLRPDRGGRRHQPPACRRTIAPTTRSG